MRVGARAARRYTDDGSPVLPAPGFGLFAEPEPKFPIAKALFHHKAADEGVRGRLEAMLDGYLNPTDYLAGEIGYKSCLALGVVGERLDPTNDFA